MGFNAPRADMDTPDLGRSDGGLVASRQAVGPYLRAIRRSWILVLLITLVAGGVAAATVLRSSYSYKATADVLVTPLPAGNPQYLGLGAVLDTGDPTRTVQTAAALVDTAQAAAATAASLGPGWTSSEVQKAVTVTGLGQTNVLAITGSASSPSAAARVANAYATSALALRGTVVQKNITTKVAQLKAQIAALPPSSPTTASQSATLSTEVASLQGAQTTGRDPTLSISQTAQPPTSHSGASHYLIVLLALLGGFALASVAALGLDFFGRPVRDADELEALFPAPVLASVPRVGHSGRGPFSPWTFPPAAFEQVRMLRVQLDLAVQAPVIMVTSAGAGDGKTTLVGALAAAFSEGGRDVIVVDLDLHRPSLAKLLGVASQAQTPVTGDGPAGALISVPRLPRVKLLPLPKAGRLSPDELMLRLPMLLAQAQRAAACVILDTAPIGQISESLRIAAMSEAVVFVARPGHTDRRLVVRSRELMTRAGVRTAGVVLVGQPAPGAYGGGYYPYAGAEAGPRSAAAEQPFEEPESDQAASRPAPAGAESASADESNLRTDHPRAPIDSSEEAAVARRGVESDERF